MQLLSNGEWLIHWLCNRKKGIFTDFLAILRPDTEIKGTQKTLTKFVKEPATNSKLMQKVGLKAVSDFV
jgi:hypothetical protein